MKLVVDDLIEDKRIDVFVTDYMQSFSRSKIQNELKSGNILVNNENVRSSYIVKPGDVVDINIKDKIIVIKPEKIDIDVVWEDENLAVINKPSGMLTHPTNSEVSGTLVNALLYKYGDNLSNINGELRRGIVHRLDRNTSGLLIVPKNNRTHEYIAEKIKLREIDKRYLAVVKGVIDEDEFVINEPIARCVTHPHKMEVNISGKDSISEVKVLKRFKTATYVEVHLITGRTHQIRVHMSSIGHPVFNDTLYGFGKMKIKTDEQVLQSYKLTFKKPFTDELINLQIEPDSKINQVLNYLNNLC